MKPETLNTEIKSTIEINSYSINTNREMKIWDESNFHDETKELLSSSTFLSYIPFNKSKDDNDYYHMNIYVGFYHGGAGGDAFISAFSLGLIPTWGTDENIYNYKFTLYKNGRLFKTQSYSVSRDNYNHLILLPFAIIDLIIFNDAINFYKKALKENLNKEV